MTERTITTSRRRALAAALALAALGALALGGCAREDYYCDATGCYTCDGVSCRPATPPTRTPCRGDYECPANNICTNLGCVPTGCRTNMDCPQGWACRLPADGGAGPSVCAAPTENPTPNPGTCRTNADCGGGAVCIDGTCTRAPTPACAADRDCTAGQVCVSGRCTAPSNTCQFDNQCGAGRVCVNSECRARCGADRPCPAGQECATVGGVSFCRNATTNTCSRDAECGSGRRCVNGACYAACMPGGSSCGSADLYCSDDGVCVPDTRPRPFCDANRPCQAGSSCVGGLCRVPCSSNMMCQMVDVTYRNCGTIPGRTETQTYCLTDNEFRPACSRQSECAATQSCIDGTCR